MRHKDIMDAPIFVLVLALIFIHGMEAFQVHGWELENMGTKPTIPFSEALVCSIIVHGRAHITPVAIYIFGDQTYSAFPIADKIASSSYPLFRYTMVESGPITQS